jgi:uncharacterized protein (TIGR02722 family)
LLHRNKFNLISLVLLGLALTALLAGCSARKTVTRTDPSEMIDLSGNWNDVDSQTMAAALVTDMSTNIGWIERHLADNGKRPVVIIGEVRNRTTEHIPVRTLVSDLEKQLMNFSSVDLVASPEEREGIRDERADQQQFSSTESAKQWGREVGADYMLVGELNSITDTEEGQSVKYYELVCDLVNLDTNIKVWRGDHKIKKFVGQRAYKP